MSGMMHAEVVAMAAGKYNPLLEPLRLKDLLWIIEQCPTISLVKRKSLEAGLVISKVEGRCVTFGMTFDLYGPTADIDSCLEYAVAYFMPSAGIGVRNGALAGEIVLPEDPYRIPTRHNGAMYFLNSEKEEALAYLARDSAVPR
jgi:hypothetical protein